MILYLIKSALCLALLYSCVYPLLRKETFHRFNRVILLGIMVSSLLVPVFTLTVNDPTQIHEYIYQLETLVVTTHSVSFEQADIWTRLSQMTVIDRVEIIYIVVFVGMLLFTLVRLGFLIAFLRDGKRQTDQLGNTIILKQGQIAPFSLFHYIVMSDHDYQHNRCPILTHEQQHIRLGHSWDLLFYEVVRLLQWFNPMAWQLGLDLKTLHEYEADEAVINQGIDAKQYQQLLVIKAVGNRLQPFANNLNRNSLKQRIIMMHQSKSSNRMMFKALLVVPALTFALFVFAEPETTKIITVPMPAMPHVQKSTVVHATPVVEVKEEKAETPSVIKTIVHEPVSEVSETTKEDDDPDKVFEIVEELPQYPGGMEALMKYLSSNISYPKDALKVGKQGRVIVQFVVKKDGTVTDAKILHSVFASLDKEALRVVNAMPKWSPAKQKGQAVSCRFTLPITFRLQ